MTDFPVTIFHNPACGTSRNVVAMVEAAGYRPEVVEYLKAPPSRETLAQLYADGRPGIPADPAQAVSRRFRPNLVIDTRPAFSGFGEHSWVGKRLAVGDLAMSVSEPKVEMPKFAPFRSCGPLNFWAAKNVIGIVFAVDTMLLMSAPLMFACTTGARPTPPSTTPRCRCPAGWT